MKRTNYPRLLSTFPDFAWLFEGEESSVFECKQFMKVIAKSNNTSIITVEEILQLININIIVSPSQKREKLTEMGIKTNITVSFLHYFFATCSDLNTELRMSYHFILRTIISCQLLLPCSIVKIYRLLLK